MSKMSSFEIETKIERVRTLAASKGDANIKLVDYVNIKANRIFHGTSFLNPRLSV